MSVMITVPCQNVSGNYTFQCMCIAIDNGFKPTYFRSAFKQSDYPTSSPASTTMKLSVAVICFVHLNIHWQSISIKTAQIELLPVHPSVTFNAEKVVVHRIMPVIYILKQSNMLCLHFVGPVIIITYSQECSVQNRIQF